MLRIIRPRRAEKIIQKYADCIEEAAAQFLLPPALIRAVLYQEMIRIDGMDLLADWAVLCRLPWKKDSSTGYAQIFGRVGLDALNYAADRGLTDCAAWQLPADHRFRRQDPKDIRLIWKKLHRSVNFNIAAAAMNLLSCTEEMTGKQDARQCTETELQLILSRYNANTRRVTAYGKSAYSHYLRYLQQETKSGARISL